MDDQTPSRRDRVLANILALAAMGGGMPIGLGVPRPRMNTEVAFKPASWACSCRNSLPCAECREKDRAAISALSDQEFALVLEQSFMTRARAEELLTDRRMGLINTVSQAATLGDVRSAPAPKRVRCESCNGRRSPEANYCPRCGHQRHRVRR